MATAWSEEYKQKVIDRYKETKNAGLVAKEFGKFRSSVLRVLKLAGVYKKPSGKGSGHSQWKGGRGVKSGYWTVYIENHPRKLNNGRIFEHILVAEKKYGRPIGKKEPIHHIDFNRLNNNPDNLYLCQNNKEHMDLHYSLEEVARELFISGKLGFKDGKYFWK